MKHPIQPVVKDEHGVERFKENAIVRYLFDSGACNMNVLARLPFDREDREQFAQLIGCSLSGASDLSYMSDRTLSAAEMMSTEGYSSDAARMQWQADTLTDVKNALKCLVPQVEKLRKQALSEEGENA